MKLTISIPLILSMLLTMCGCDNWSDMPTDEYLAQIFTDNRDSFEDIVNIVRESSYKEIYPDDAFEHCTPSSHEDSLRCRFLEENRERLDSLLSITGCEWIRFTGSEIARKTGLDPDTSEIRFIYYSKGMVSFGLSKEIIYAKSKPML